MNYTTRTQKNKQFSREVASQPSPPSYTCPATPYMSNQQVHWSCGPTTRSYHVLKFFPTSGHEGTFATLTANINNCVYIYILFCYYIYIYIYICAYKYTVPHENINDIGTGVRVPWVPLLTSWSNVSPTQSFFALLIPPHSHVVGACWDNFNNPKESAMNATFRTGDKSHGVRFGLIFWHYGKRQILASVVSLPSCF